MEDAKNMAMQPMRVWYTPRMVSVVEVFMKKERKGLVQFRSPLHSLCQLTVKVLNIASVQSGAVLPPRITTKIPALATAARTFGLESILDQLQLLLGASEANQHGIQAAR